MATKPKHVYLIAAARKISRWSPEHREAIADATVDNDWVRCACCRKLIPKRVKVKKRYQYQVDHIDPVVPVDKKSPTLEQTPGSSDFCTWDEWLRRLMYGARQVLCIPCHKKKTKGENSERERKRQSVPALRRAKRK